MEVKQLYKAAEIEDALSDPETAHLVLDRDEVVGMNKVPGLTVEPQQIEDGVDVYINLDEGTVVEKPVHLCFGVTDREAIQRIILDIEIEDNAEIGILAHCVFPRALDVKHVMDADIRIGKNAKYTYLEKHIHSPEGGVNVVPSARVELGENSRFESDFELVKGRVGELDIDYETTCRKDSVMEMTAKVDGRGDDVVKISETGNLVGEGARGVLTTRVALREKARAEVFNKLTADAPYARGHVDCKEIVQGEGSAKAVPIVEVNHPKAHVTHEAAIGSVDTKQLETLMSRGLSEDESVDLIIEGLLS
ncbi:SufBD protein [candidate division MSBL1 archaeon SCGC-AAA259M10]|uniref:SufBD protein n=2 Tax=candidate division MSBL1 TaxID=215777 RepID=A0A133U6W5_9EURY|nr:SufBD protein [candidate division MSBL1 archaeon SCGC-AAA259B11]KXA99912.1 SufBD protein [candidate division MSBL1 archaeon SCGC-AAA259M10]